jgi:hypothetical protein
MFVASACLLTGCATVASSGRDGQQTTSARRAETVYRLPRTVLAVTANRADGTIKVTKSAEADPDPRAEFGFQYEPSAFAHDTVTVETESSGLLKSVSSSSADKSAEISLNVAKAVFAIGSGGAAFPAGRRLPETLPGKTGFAASYDPLDPDDVRRTRAGLDQAGFCILVGAETARGSRACAAAGAPVVAPRHAQGPARPRPRSSGVFYRQETSEPVDIYRRSKAGWELLFAGNETFFSKADIFQVPIDRAAFVEKKVDLTFTGGALTKAKVEKPSEALAASSAALNVVTAVVAIPFAALNQRKALIDAQAGKIQAETALLQRQNELAKLQAEQQVAGPDALARSNFDAVDAGGSGRGLGAAGDARALDLCQTNLGASTANCRAYVERRLDEF